MLRDTNKNQHLRPPSAALIFDDGKILWGYGIGAVNAVVAELCFNTSQTGYQETLTDPSYAKQIITFTFPHIGITGTNSEDLESDKIFAEGCIINQPIGNYSNWRAEKKLDVFLSNQNTPGISGIDTRYLTRRLSENGAEKVALINFGDNKHDFQNLQKNLAEWGGLENLDLASVVSTKKQFTWNEDLWQKTNKKNSYKNFPIVCLDFGIKHNILRNLNNLNFTTTILPSSSSIKEILENKPKGIFLSNGPGDPDATIKVILPTIKELISLKIPIFGICLGHQIIAQAMGGKIIKAKNQMHGKISKINVFKSKIFKKFPKFIYGTRYHSLIVDSKKLPKNLCVTAETESKIIMGISHINYDVHGIQFHPESIKTNLGKNIIKNFLK